MAQSDARELEKDGTEKPRRRFDARDFDYIAEYVIGEYERRKKDRADKERCWKEIDRQIAMEPEIGFKYIVKDGTRVIDPKKTWMAEVELPLQAQALEVLTADARRMLFPDGAWFRAHAAVTDDYLRKVDFKSLILGDETEVPSLITQDNADKLVEGFLMHLFAESAGDNNEDFFTRYDKIDAEAFKYGVGVGRGVMWNRALYNKVPGGMRREVRKLPVLQPCSIKNLYLDDRKPSMHSLQLLEPAHIAFDYIKLENLQMAANRGGTEPDSDDGGWMPKNLKDIEPDDKGYVTLLEMEGDIVVPRKTTRSLVLPGVIVTVVLGGKSTSGSNATRATVRLRWRQTPGSSYFLHPYHYEGADDIYPASPLMKGRPVQIMCTDALNRLLDSAMLKTAPPVGWDRSDSLFAQEGGPSIHPYAQWATMDPGAIKVHHEVGGDPSALSAVLARGISLYAELTGVLPARLGAQTTSHTTAFAKDAELQRGAVRTVDYVRQIGKGPMTRWLDMAYRMGRSAIGGRETVTFFIDAYGGWVEVSLDQLPERASFEWFGAGGPADEQQKRQMRLQALQFALQMDQMGAALGKQPAIALDGAIAQVLREGGWTDLDALLGTAQPATPAALPPPAGLVSADPALIA